MEISLYNFIFLEIEQARSSSRYDKRAREEKEDTTLFHTFTMCCVLCKVDEGRTIREARR